MRKAFEGLLDAARSRPTGWLQAFSNGPGETVRLRSREGIPRWDDCWSSGKSSGDDSEDEDYNDEFEDKETLRFEEVADAEDEDEDGNRIGKDHHEEFHEVEEERTRTRREFSLLFFQFNLGAFL